MRNGQLYIPVTTLILILSLFAASQPAAAQHETVIYNFTENDNLGPQDGLALDASGNLYGTSNDSVYELLPQSGGGWSEKMLFTAAAEQNTYGFRLSMRKAICMVPVLAASTTAIAVLAAWFSSSILAGI